MPTTDTAYGYCPKCGARGATRERRINGFDTCVEGHKYPSADSLKHKPSEPGMNSPLSTTISELLKTDVQRGPLAVCVTTHAQAEAISEMLALSHGPGDQGIRVIPFGASALAYCGPGTLLFRGLVTVAPRDNDSVAQALYEAWVASAVQPYLAPGAARIYL